MQQKKRNQKVKWLIFGGIILIIVVLAIAIPLIFLKSDSGPRSYYNPYSVDKATIKETT